ncbi:uncharacterized protein LOC141620691 [Silene latifolia]|uniref:uncharacterized protein LOC141620691 n=1 Tax=Silene latifolia TaxID=37657 RepID=UPI003D7700C0
MPENISDDSLYSLLDDPLFISPTDQPSLTLFSSLFNYTNFLQWQREVLWALMSKNKVGFVSGKCEIPAQTDKKYNSWIRCDLLVLRWIKNSLEPKLRKNFQYAISAKNIWTDIVEQFGQPNVLELYYLKKDLSNFSQDNLSLLEYYRQIKSLGRILIGWIPYHSVLVDNREMHLSIAQTSGYEQVQTNLLTMEPLPPINKALSLLQKIEKQNIINDVTSYVVLESVTYATKKQYSTTTSIDEDRETKDRSSMMLLLM